MPDLTVRRGWATLGRVAFGLAPGAIVFLYALAKYRWGWF